MAHTNILLLYVDQMRYDAMGCAGNPVIRTPALDQLAAEGANFTRAVTSVPVCVAARHSLLTGHRCATHGRFANNKPDPEPNLYTIPQLLGSAGYLTRAIGKSKAMEMCLTGRMMEAEEAERSGLISRIVPVVDLVESSVKTASRIAEMPPAVAMMVKEAVNRAFETSLGEGIRFERRLFQATFGTLDQKEGMAAFVDKRNPRFKGE